MRPLQLRVQSLTASLSEETIMLDNDLTMHDLTPPVVDDDYRPFFESISIIGTIED